MGQRYILKDNQPELCEDLEEWAVWYGSNNHQIASNSLGNTSVSTAFIGIAAGEVDGLPMLFETLVSPSGEVRRYATYQQALEGHERIVRDLAGSRLEN